MLATSTVVDLTLVGFVIVAVIAIVLSLFSRRDRRRAIRFGFFLEHERRPEGEEDEKLEDTRIMWPGEKEERRGKE